MAPWVRVSSGAKIWQEIGQVVLSGAALRMVVSPYRWPFYPLLIGYYRIYRWF